MTVLGTAAKVYAGSTAAVAVYAGSVKVWPLGPPPLPVDGHATWDVQPDGSVRFSVAEIDGLTTGTYTVQVAPAPPLDHSAFVLGTASTFGAATTYWAGRPVTFIPNRTTTAGEAAAAWGGKVVLVTFNDLNAISALEPQVPAVWATQFGRLKLTVSTVSPATGRVALIAVPAAPATVPNPGNVLGVATPPPAGIATTYWGSTGALVGFQDPALQHITNQEAVDQWSGMLLVVEFASVMDIRSLTVLGPTP
jgi:hypothetical protein